MPRDFEFGAEERDGATVRVPVRVPDDLAYLEGHFPGDPIVPGVAQLVPLAEARARIAWPDLGGVAGVRRLKFMRGLRPGDELVLVLEREPEAPRVKFRIAAGQDECTRGTLLFAGEDRKSTRLNSSHRSLSRMPSSA